MTDFTNIGLSLSSVPPTTVSPSFNSFLYPVYSHSPSPHTTPPGCNTTPRDSFHECITPLARHIFPWYTSKIKKKNVFKIRVFQFFSFFLLVLVSPLFQPTLSFQALLILFYLAMVQVFPFAADGTAAAASLRFSLCSLEGLCGYLVAGFPSGMFFFFFFFQRQTGCFCKDAKLQTK